ncbi:unnamed protein product [Amoebophrya sp. A25]|nr:unnamed protein product [Amoebophrya sp. A25]|eukprot:GSA25T00005915001.1
MGADTNTACYDKDKHVSRDGASIPLILQNYWSREEAFIKHGLPVKVLRCNFFMNHLLKTECDNIKSEGWFSNPLGNTRNSFVSTSDIEEAAAARLMEGPEKHANKFYDIFTGPEPHQSMSEIAADLSTALGKKIEYRAQGFEQFEKDFGPTRAAFIFEYLTNGFYTRCSPDFYNLTGRSYAPKFLHHYHQFQETYKVYRVSAEQGSSWRDMSRGAMARKYVEKRRRCYESCR